jgi:hypothetical protein
MWCTSRCISITIGRCLRLQWPSRIVVDFSAFCWYPMFLACAWEKSEALGNDIPTSLFFCTCAVLQQQNLGPGPCVFFKTKPLHVGTFGGWLLISMSFPLSNDIMYLLWLIRARIISWNAQAFARWSGWSSQNYFWGEPWNIMGHTRQNSKCLFSFPSLRRSACNSRLASDFRLPPHLSSAVSLRGKCWTNTELDTFV